MNTQSTYSSGASFTVPLISTTSRINLYSTGGLADIGAMAFSGSTSQSSVDVVIGSGALNSDREANLSNAADDWGGCSFPFSARLSGAISGNLTGGVNAASIVRLEVHGQVSGAISATTTTGVSIGYLQFGSSTSAGTITAGKDVATIEAESTASPMAGALTAGGKIDLVSAAGEVSIASGGIQAADGIGAIIVVGDLDADINANTANHNPTTSTYHLGVLYRLECSDLSGSVTARGLEDHQVTAGAAIVAETVAAQLTFTGDVYGDIQVDEFTGSGEVVVGGTLKGSVVAEGNITSVTVGGDIDILNTSTNTYICSETGSIGAVLVAGAIKPEFGSLVSEHPIQITAPGWIDYIECAEFEGLVAGAPNSEDPTSIYSFVVHGNLEASRIHAHCLLVFDVEGDFGESAVMFLDHMCLPENQPPTIETFRIGASLLGLIAMHDGTDPTGPQVSMVVNALDTSGGISLEGAVAFELGSTPRAVTTADHSVLASELTGYERFYVGVVPFQLHEADCLPEHSESPECTSFETRLWPSSHGGGTRDTIVLRFYGPVFDAADDYGDPDDPNTKPLIIKVQSLVLCTPSPCEDEEDTLTDRTDLFDVYVPAHASALAYQREVWIARQLDNKPATIGSYRYVIEPRLDGNGDRYLRCDKTFFSPANAPEVADFTYERDPTCESLWGP